MNRFLFFDNVASYRENIFQSKLQIAIKMIEKNNSLIAIKVLEAIRSNKVIIHSFHGLSQEHYHQTKKDLNEDSNIALPNIYPPSDSAVALIESVLNGVIYQDKYIYLSSKKNPKGIASTLIHEITHYLNCRLYDEELKSKKAKLVSYRDEVRSFTAEIMFQKNGHCITRSDVRKIHATVADLYPEFTTPDEDYSKQGLIYGSYDSPMD